MRTFALTTVSGPTSAANWVFTAPGSVERIEARLVGAAFRPHRHDTYAVGLTLEGVQSFDYRGAARHSLPGQMVVLHPDELHDGRAGDSAPFRYRAIYIAPAQIQRVLGGRALPFVDGGVSDDHRLRGALGALLDDLARPLGTFEFDQALYDLTIALVEAGRGTMSPHIANHKAVALARDYIDANLRGPLHLDDLERVTGHDRWQLSRDFRALLGASPYRYFVFRKLDHARQMMAAGHGIAEVALACGFADQSHFSRHFRKAFGLTPATWTAVQARATGAV